MFLHVTRLSIRHGWKGNRCPTLCGTAKHFYLLTCVPHFETMSHIFTGSSSQRSNPDRTDRPKLLSKAVNVDAESP